VVSLPSEPGAIAKFTGRFAVNVIVPPDNATAGVGEVVTTKPPFTGAAACADAHTENRLNRTIDFMPILRPS
jgi:hypothetical protein